MQVQQSAVKYHFSFRTLSDRNMKIGCHAILFLQRTNLVPRGYIILHRTHSFHRISKIEKKAGTLRFERTETIIHFRRNMMAQPSFYY